MTPRQRQIESKVRTIANLFQVDPKWAAAIAMVESSLGEKQISPTGCRGVFQMSMIAMKDLWLTMQDLDDDLVDITCGVAFLRLLLKRWGNIEGATKHFCNPADKEFYWDRVKKYYDGV